MAVFWNRPLWEAAGPLDVDRHLDMDYDLWLRFAKVAEPRVLRRELADFRAHAGAKGSRHTGAQLDAALARPGSTHGGLRVERAGRATGPSSGLQLADAAGVSVAQAVRKGLVGRDERDGQDGAGQRKCILVRPQNLWVVPAPFLDGGGR